MSEADAGVFIGISQSLNLSLIHHPPSSKLNVLTLNYTWSFLNLPFRWQQDCCVSKCARLNPGQGDGRLAVALCQQALLYVRACGPFICVFIHVYVWRTNQRRGGGCQCELLPSLILYRINKREECWGRGGSWGDTSEKERRMERKDHSKKASSQMTHDPDWL